VSKKECRADLLEGDARHAARGAATCTLLHPQKRYYPKRESNTKEKSNRGRIPLPLSGQIAYALAIAFGIGLGPGLVPGMEYQGARPRRSDTSTVEKTWGKSNRHGGRAGPFTS
jgi:hypothetical protein